MLTKPSPGKKFCLLICAALVILLAACGAENTATPNVAASPQPSAVIDPTATLLSPSPTPPPLAATVDGAWILQEDFDTELLRYQDANPGDSTPAEEQRQTVLDSLIEETLLAKAAEEAGQSLDDAALQARIEALAGKMGGIQALSEWQARNHYSEESFRRALRRSALAAWQRDQITAAVPQTAEQVHARQILLRDLPVAQNLHNQLVNGADFATLSLQYDPVTGGELGWFPRGFLTQPVVEEAAFALQPEQFSDIIESPIGYHIVYVVERDSQHALSPEALRVLQGQALAAWLDQHRAESQITILLP